MSVLGNRPCTVATDALVLKHQAISNHSAAQHLKVWEGNTDQWIILDPTTIWKIGSQYGVLQFGRHWYTVDAKVIDVYCKISITFLLDVIIHPCPKC